MKVYINQLGYLPESQKTAIIAGKEKCDKIRVINEDDGSVSEKAVQYFGYDKASHDDIWQADFSELKKEGNYRIEAVAKETENFEESGREGGYKTAPDSLSANSFNFKISRGIYSDLNKSLCKALYFQRCGMALEEKYAGIFHRECCHTGKAVRLEDYVKAASSDEKNEPRLFDVRGGWHDAGDYGRYTTAAATALAHILYAWKFFPESFKVSLNIPESGGMDDILQECLYELRWLLKMQMADGSVCHKLTSMRHANFVMPCQDKRQMILFPPSTMAAGAFAAVMALAARTYAGLDSEFSHQALNAAKNAWCWLEKHQEFIGFENPEGCNTGGYEDTSDDDERLWAAAELYRTTGDESYLAEAESFLADIEDKTALGWMDTAGIAGWALLEETFAEGASAVTCEKTADKTSGQASRDGGIYEKLRGQFSEWFINAANRYAVTADDCGYKAAMAIEDYGWGSNMVLLNRGMIFASAYMLSGEEKYKAYALSQMDYLLGVNALGMSYVTGMGENAFKNPHNRVTVADGIDETIPGFVSGGPNANPVDEKAEWLIEPGTPPMKCFLDVWECYSLNEITIYWNSPAIFLAAFLDSER